MQGQHDNDMLKEAGRQLQEEVDRQLGLWGTEGWVSDGHGEQGMASDAASALPVASPSITTEMEMDVDDPDAMAAMFFAKQKAKQKKAEKLPVNVLARNIVWLAKQNEESEMENAEVLVVAKGKEELVDHLCQKFMEYQQT